MEEADYMSEVSVWTDADHALLVGKVLDHMGDAIHVARIGGPRHNDVAELARKYDVPHDDDLRKLIVDQPPRFVLLASGQGVAVEGVLAAGENSVTVLAVEPPASNFDVLDRLMKKQSGPPGIDRCFTLPMFRRAPGWRKAANPTEVMTNARLISFESFGKPGDCSLFARLSDAWSTVLAFTELPEWIDASLSGPYGEPPEDPRAMSGSLAAKARLGDGASVVVQVSDRSGVVYRRLHAISDDNQLLVDDLAYSLHRTGGELMDESPADDAAAAYDFARLIADEWQLLLDRPPESMDDLAGDVIVHPRDVLACCLACQLSARTGEPEDPRRVIQMYSMSGE